MSPPDPVTVALDAVASGEDLSAAQAGSVMARIMRGEVSEIQIAGFLIALRTKGETVEELTGLAATMRELATPVRVDRGDLLDTAGTGGGRRTFNVSTTAALIAAGAGCVVAKHGNRSATGLSGSADLIEALGARIDLDPAQVARCIEQAGFGFMFAPAHHQATRYVVPVRRALAVRTIFNFLGPLTNPAGAERQLIGVSDGRYLETMALALGRLGTRHALVVSSEDGLDELSISAPTIVYEVTPGSANRSVVTPEDVGLRRAPAESIPGGDPAQNAAIARAILGGEAGPSRDLAVFNAGAAIYAGGAAESLAGGVDAAQTAIDSGAAFAALQRFVETTWRLAGAPGAHPLVNELQRIVVRTRGELAERMVARPRAELRAAAVARLERDPPRGFAAALARDGLSVIAEHKRRSPSAGPIRDDLALEDVVGAYARGGARAVSVLTERVGFGGTLEDLARARAACRLPILRKDFIVDPYQVDEAVAGGADAILLIVAALEDPALRELHAQASRDGLDVLVEIHDAAELDRAMNAIVPAPGGRGVIIGINNRDLTTLHVDPERTFELRGSVPPGVLTVSESGLRDPAMLDRVAAAGIDAVLIGESLMRAADVEQACRAFTTRPGREPTRSGRGAARLQ